MRVLFTLATAANYTQCINTLSNKPMGWVIDCVLHTTGYLALSPEQIATIKTLANTTYELSNKELYKTIISHDYVIPVWGEGSYDIFYGFTDSAKLKTFSKSEIYKLALQCGISTPEVYKIPNKYPLIAKPLNGTGSLGVKKIHDIYEYYDFFLREHPKTSAMQTARKNGYAPHDYFDLGRGYQIEEYLEGTVSTIVGCIINGKVYVGYTYDIESNIDEYLTTTKASLPSKNHLMLEDFADKIQNLLRMMDVDNTPFIADVVVNNKTLYLIDFGLRFGGNELTYQVCNSWMFDVIDAIKKHKAPGRLLLNKSYVFQVLPFQKGIITNFTIDSSLADKFQEPSSREFYKCKNLHTMIPRGYVIVSGDSLDSAEMKLKSILNTFKVNYE